MWLKSFRLVFLAGFSPTLFGSPIHGGGHAAPRVHLGYATYEGTTLENGVQQFLGMRYAAAPLGGNRFRRPRDPLNETKVVPAVKHGAVCYGVQGLTFGSPQGIKLGEDCLFVDVYTPSTSLADSDCGLPVMVWLQGGAFVQLFNPNYNGTGIVEASHGKVIVVSFNYRVGPYGFFATEELEKEGNLNIGLHDQRFALSWVHKHIKAFGGDPDKVTLFGTSVGAGSVLLQTVAYGGSPPEGDIARWNAGIAPAAYMPSVYEVSDLAYQYETLLTATNCSDLACLRSLDSDTIQAANNATLFPGTLPVALFPYAPVIDHQLFTDHPQAMLQAGNFSRARPLMIGSSHSEGTLFVPPADTTADINAFLKLQFPTLTQSDLEAARSLYSTVPSTFAGVNVTKSPLFYKAAAMYGDVSFTCPTLQFASVLSESNVDIYYFRNNVVDPVELGTGYIVPHTWEVQAVWGPEYAVSYVALPSADSYDVGGINRNVVAEVQHFWIQFATTGGNLGDGPTNTPTWSRFNDQLQRFRLQTNSSAMEDIAKIELDRCVFWTSLASRTLI
ncbi:alpha/beta-hydrolase [Lentithecium fluviatile CBS 122367]|uniref:Alpha/beta-hydrolase n=1 Tax=Lentithecium fluviatile CBS 122367 TaxID=1168545 RepID=A0A6G1JHQ8_9PLEO|nr:alpha/beta-hydrolase [Lentithecium fluviatile CBS 122367]